MGHEIQLSGGEITILKAIGLSGTAMGGKFLLDRMEEVEAGEFIDTLGGLAGDGLPPRHQGEYSDVGGCGTRFFSRESVLRA